MEKSPLYYLVLMATAFFLILLGTSSCEHSTDPKTHSVSGVVNDGARAGLEGVSVFLYHHIPIEAEVLTFKQSYPNHGANLEQYNTFDHRTSTPVALVTTAMDGAFTLNGVDNGTYELVAYKQGYGYKYLLNLVVSDNMTGIQISMPAVISLPSTISEDMSLESGNTYYIGNDCLVLPGKLVSVGTDVIVIMEPNTKLVVYGQLETTSTSSIKIQSSDKLYSHSNQPSAIGRLDSITLFSQANQTVQNVKLMDSLLGFRSIESQNMILKNSYFVSEYQSVTVVGSTNFKMNQCTISGSSEIIRAAAYFEHSDSTTIEKCHFFGNKISAQISGSANSVVRNNYFCGSTMYDFGFAQDGAGTVEYNTFRSSINAIHNYRGQMYANYNDIEAEVGIYSFRVDAWFSANNNNLNCTQYGIKSCCMYWNSPIIHLDGTKNYWFTNDLAAIEQKIYDRDNDSPSDENYHLLVTQIDFQPISNNKQNAGIFD